MSNTLELENQRLLEEVLLEDVAHISPLREIITATIEDVDKYRPNYLNLLLNELIADLMEDKCL